MGTGGLYVVARPQVGRSQHQVGFSIGGTKDNRGQKCPWINDHHDGAWPVHSTTHHKHPYNGGVEFSVLTSTPLLTCTLHGPLAQVVILTGVFQGGQPKGMEGYPKNPALNRAARAT